jgi:hypothetical protein
MAANLHLKKFDMSKIGKGSVVIMIGKRNTGKSYLVQDLLYYKRDIPIGTVISATEGANQFYGDMMPKIFIHDEFNSQIVSNLVKRQKIAITKMQQQEAQFGKTNIDPFAYLILDDLMYDTSWLKDQTIRSLFMNGRHYKLLFVITMQYSLGIPPSLRSNVDYVFILRENYVSNRKRLYEHYAGMFPSFEVFCQVMDQCTENYDCLVIDNTTKSNKIEDMVFWYHADPHPPFKLGSPEFWQHHSNHYDDNNNGGDTDELDINQLKVKKNSVAINVRKNY